MLNWSENSIPIETGSQSHSRQQFFQRRAGLNIVGHCKGREKERVDRPDPGLCQAADCRLP